VFSEAVPGLPISSLIDVRSGYNQKMLHQDSRDYMAFQMMQGLYRPTRLVKGATIPVSTFVRVSQIILNTVLQPITEIFVDNVRAKGRKSGYGNKVVEGVPGVRKFAMDHLQNLDNILADVQRAGATIPREKSDWGWNRVTIVEFVSREAGRWPLPSKFDKLWNWHWRAMCTECRAYFGLCTYY